MAKPSALDVFLDGCAPVLSLAAGTAETSFYPALAAALNAAGDALTPKVFALHHPSGKAAGIPDFGFFLKPSGRNAALPGWGEGASPERGVLELKPLAANLDRIAASDQVRARYLPRYGLVLVSNLRQWRLLGPGGAVLEALDLAEDEAGFRALAHGPRTAARRTRFEAFLQRCLLTQAPIARPAELAMFLSSYAREARARMEEQAALPALKSLKEALEKGLGFGFDQKDGEWMFRSSTVQTLFYGLFSAWVAHVRDQPGAPFHWRAADWSLHVPVMRLLFQEVAKPQTLKPLGLDALLDAAAVALARVDREAFFTAFEERLAVQHFYEPFLEHFDPRMRKELGVWYTPPEIVDYMVERVDRLLREELGRADGLADDSVVVLDPCCGTGSFLLAVIERIRRTWQARGLGDALGERLSQAARTRVVGFEIMPAPFMIAHFQVGEALRRVQAPLADGETAAIFLTNALTGWDPEEIHPDLEATYEVLTRERDKAGTVKRQDRILVVIGNPPYNAFAGISPATERGLVEPYKAGLAETWKVKKFNLDDLYVRFFRVAERRVAEMTGEGVVCFISNFSWLAGASFTVMRQRILDHFDAVYVDNLHGDSRETGKLCPDGSPDPSAFSTDFAREGIRTGTAIVTLVKTQGAA